MKRHAFLLFGVSLILAIIFVTSLFGCGIISPPSETSPPATSPMPLSTPTSTPIPQPPVPLPIPPTTIATPPTSSTPAPATQGISIALPSFADLIDAVEHSVVAINTETVVSGRFIQRTLQGAGSGWVIDGTGVIVTNNHVIEGADTITVELQDGRTYTPVSISTDPASDLAVLKINAGTLPALKVADVSKVRVGDWVIAVGNALGLGISVKNGIVSRLNVNIEVSPGESYMNLIETNAAINPGNSGGPLLNMAGEVVGITSLKLSTAGVEGMGYAINMTEALSIIQRLSQ